MIKKFRKISMGEIKMAGPWITENEKNTVVHVKFVNVDTSAQLGKIYYQPADEYHPEFKMDVYSE